MKKVIVSISLVAVAATLMTPALAWRGGFGGGGFARGGGGFAAFRGPEGRFHAGGVTRDGGTWHAGGDDGAYHAGGTTAGGEHWQAGGVAGEGGAWHAGGVDGNGGTWHNDGYHAAAVGGGYGYHDATVVNSYYGGGCYNCGGAGVAAAAAAGAAVGAAAATMAVGATLATLPPACDRRLIGGDAYYVCNGTWFVPRFGNNGVYYVVVDPL